MRGFLLDSHVTGTLIAPLEREIPTCEVHHLAAWRGGAYLHEDDAVILVEAALDDLVLVSFDVATLPDTVLRLVEGGKKLAGVALFPTRSRRVGSIGGLVRALADLYANAAEFDPAYPVIYLRPA